MPHEIHAEISIDGFTLHADVTPAGDYQVVVTGPDGVRVTVEAPTLHGPFKLTASAPSIDALKHNATAGQHAADYFAGLAKQFGGGK